MSPTTYQEAITLLDKYPYFTFAAIRALDNAPDAEARNRLSRLIAVNIGDHIDTAEILGLNSESLADFYPDSLPPRLDTIDTIDTFLSTFGTQPANPSPQTLPPDQFGETALSQGETTNPSPQNLPLEQIGEAGLSQGEKFEQGENPDQTQPDSTTSAIDAFLRAVPPPQPRRRQPKPTPKTEETPALTESFARILIKKQNYEKALEIIQELNLKNPEKSVYFADQIRFLKKLIINQAAKKR